MEEPNTRVGWTNAIIEQGAVPKEVLKDMSRNPGELRASIISVTRHIAEKILKSNPDRAVRNELVLASQSERRLELLRAVEIADMKVVQETPSVPAEIDIAWLNAQQNAMIIAFQKQINWWLSDCPKKGYPAILITADTILELPNGTPIGKFGGPLDPFGSMPVKEKLRMVTASSLSGHSCAIVTCFSEEDRSLNVFALTDAAQLRFLPPNTRLRESKAAFAACGRCRVSATCSDAITQYAQSGSFHGKAGGFDLRDSLFAATVASVDGDPFAIVGLPMRKLCSRWDKTTKYDALLMQTWRFGLPDQGNDKLLEHLIGVLQHPEELFGIIRPIAEAEFKKGVVDESGHILFPRTESLVSKLLEHWAHRECGDLLPNSDDIKDFGICFTNDSPHRKKVLKGLIGEGIKPIQFDIADDREIHKMDRYRLSMDPVLLLVLATLQRVLHWCTGRLQDLPQKKGTVVGVITRMFRGAESLGKPEEDGGFEDFVQLFAESGDNDIKVVTACSMVSILPEVKETSQSIRFRVKAGFEQSFLTLRSPREPLTLDDYCILSELANSSDENYDNLFDLPYADENKMRDYFRVDNEEDLSASGKNVTVEGFIGKQLSVGDVLRSYFDNRKHLGKSAGIGIQDRDLFVCIRRVEGDPMSIIGVPRRLFLEWLSTFGTPCDMSSLVETFWPDKRIEQSKIIADDSETLRLRHDYGKRVKQEVSRRIAILEQMLAADGFVRTASDAPKYWFDTLCLAHAARQFEQMELLCSLDLHRKNEAMRKLSEVVSQCNRELCSGRLRNSTTLSLADRLDKVGNTLYKGSGDRFSGKEQLIPRACVENADQLRAFLVCHGGTDSLSQLYGNEKMEAWALGIPRFVSILDELRDISNPHERYLRILAEIAAANASTSMTTRLRSSNALIDERECLLAFLLRDNPGCRVELTIGNVGLECMLTLFLAVSLKNAGYDVKLICESTNCHTYNATQSDYLFIRPLFADLISNGDTGCDLWGYGDLHKLVRPEDTDEAEKALAKLLRGELIDDKLIEEPSVLITVGEVWYTEIVGKDELKLPPYFINDNRRVFSVHTHKSRLKPLAITSEALFASKGRFVDGDLTLGKPAFQIFLPQAEDHANGWRVATAAAIFSPGLLQKVRDDVARIKGQVLNDCRAYAGLKEDISHIEEKKGKKTISFCYRSPKKFVEVLVTDTKVTTKIVMEYDEDRITRTGGTDWSHLKNKIHRLIIGTFRALQHETTVFAEGLKRIQADDLKVSWGVRGDANTKKGHHYVDIRLTPAEDHPLAALLQAPGQIRISTPKFCS